MRHTFYRHLFCLALAISAKGDTILVNGLNGLGSTSAVTGVSGIGISSTNLAGVEINVPPGNPLFAITTIGVYLASSTGLHNAPVAELYSALSNGTPGISFVVPIPLTLQGSSPVPGGTAEYYSASGTLTGIYNPGNWFIEFATQGSDTATILSTGTFNGSAYTAGTLPIAAVGSTPVTMPAAIVVAGVAAPEPASFLLFAAGLLTCLAARAIAQRAAGHRSPQVLQLR